MPPGKLKSIDIHSYRTPPANNDGNDYYSVGVLNVTAKEAEMIKTFAQRVQAARNNPDIGSITVPVTGMVSPRVTTTGEFAENVRRVGTTIVDGARGDRLNLNKVTRVGRGVPSDDSGVDGDSYLNEYEGDLYIRSNGSWRLRGNVIEQTYDPSDNTFKVSLTTREEKPVKAKKIGGRFSGLDLDGD